MFTRLSAAALAALTLLTLEPAHAGSASGPTLIIWAGTLLAVPGHAPVINQSIVIRRGRIERVSSGRVEASALGLDPRRTRVVDLSCCFVLPGWFDLHVHLTTDPGPDGWQDDVVLTSADLARRAASNARKTVEAGFTTVLDMGTGRRSHELAIYSVRDAIQSGQLTGPRILAVGSPISSPGNARTAHYSPEVERLIGPQAVCTGADQCRRAVREQVERGADVISFYNTGSLLSPDSPAQTFTEAEMRAIVTAAHSLGRKVVADGAGKPASAAGVDAAIEAGADWVDTVIYPGQRTWALADRAGAMYAPHLYAVVAAVGDDEAHLREGSMGWLPEPVLEALLHLKREAPAAIAAHAAGIRMVYASDAGVFPHGQNGHEFAEYAKVGLTPAELLATATVNSAAALGVSADSGTLEAGKRADLVAVLGNPLENLASLLHVKLVIAGGTVVTRSQAGSGGYPRVASPPGTWQDAPRAAATHYASRIAARGEGN